MRDITSTVIPSARPRQRSEVEGSENICTCKDSSTARQLRYRFARDDIQTILFFFLLLFTYPAYAQGMDMQAIGKIPVLHEGRIKPLDSFARAQLKALSGREKNAVPWLIETLFDPARGEKRPVLKVINPEIRTLLHLEKRKSRLYSYMEITRALRSRQDMILDILKEPEENWSRQQRDLVMLQQNITTLQQLLGSLAMVVPLSVNLPDGDAVTYMRSLALQDSIKKRLQDIVAEKGGNIDLYTPAEQSLAHMSFTVNLLRKTNRNNTLLKIIPAPSGNWQSPWEAVLAGEKVDALSFLEKLGQAWHAGDAAAWRAAADGLYTATRSNTRINALRAEYYYNHYNPFYISFLFCLAGAGVLIVFFVFQNPSSPGFRFTDRFVFLLLCASVIAQISGLALRMFILQRPPVSTLYETILFVCCIVMLYALVVFYKNRHALWLWIAAGPGIFLHLLGFAHNGAGDSFVTLAAVLNTNFWLSTHVLCITTAYAFCALTSLLAHYALAQMIYKGERCPDTQLFSHIHTAALLSLFFALTGTVLGGIWADQSWGRFWGWDPKENGALLIVLWLIWVIHGRISGQMKPFAVLCALSFLSVILALSWFGVNLLGVGLHAYGFTDAASWSLGLFAGLESLFIAGAVIAAKKYA